MRSMVIVNRLFENPEMSLDKGMAMAGGKPVREQPLETMEENIVVLRQPTDGFMAKGYTIVYFMDSPESAKAMRAGEIPYLLFPRGTFMAGGSPITDIWKKKYAKPGTEGILGVLVGHSDEKKIYVDMMSIRTGWRRNRINTLMIDALRSMYPKAKLEYSDPTPQGSKFIAGYTKSSTKNTGTRST